MRPRCGLFFFDSSVQLAQDGFVENSVFECSLDAAQYRLLKAKRCDISDMERDSLRFYNFGNNYHNRIEHFGAKGGYDAVGPLIL